MMDLFVYEIKRPAMLYDENIAAPPMTRHVARPSDIFSLYNYVAYEKGDFYFRN